MTQEQGSQEPVAGGGEGRREDAAPSAGAEAEGRAGARDDGGQARPGRPRRRRRHRRPEGEGSAPAPTAPVAVQTLSGLLREVLREEGLEEQRFPDSVEVTLRIPLREEETAEAAAHLAQEVRDRVRMWTMAEGALVPGRAWCFFCESVMCQHARPVGPRDVLDGYSSTGRPRFTDFVTLAIERREPGLESLLAGERRLLAFVDAGDALRTEQLSEFGKASPVYNLLGQVTAGLFDVDRDRQKRGALSFQAVLVRAADGSPQLKAHYVAAVDLKEVGGESLQEIYHAFKKRLEHESVRVAGLERAAPGNQESGKEGAAEAGIRSRVLSALRALARDLTHESLGRERRTRHARDRAVERQRPTENAYPDALRAADASILVDAVEDTVIVLGPKNRAHVFSPDARHVTSVVIGGHALQKRLRTGRWRQAEPEQRGTFRVALRGRTNEEARKEAQAARDRRRHAAPQAAPPPPPPAPEAVPQPAAPSPPAAADEAPAPPPAPSVPAGEGGAAGEGGTAGAEAMASGEEDTTTGQAPPAVEPSAGGNETPPAEATPPEERLSPGHEPSPPPPGPP